VAKKRAKTKTKARKAKPRAKAKTRTRAKTTAADKHKPAKLLPASKVRTKSEILNILADQANLTRKQVVAVFEGLQEVLAKDLGKRGPGSVQIPGLMKVVVKRMPAKKARKGINPFTKEPTVFKAKPARNVVKVRPLSGLKNLV